MLNTEQPEKSTQKFEERREQQKAERFGLFDFSTFRI